jgi:hypothetical protein
VVQPNQLARLRASWGHIADLLLTLMLPQKTTSMLGCHTVTQVGVERNAVGDAAYDRRGVAAVGDGREVRASLSGE